MTSTKFLYDLGYFISPLGNYLLNQDEMRISVIFSFTFLYTSTINHHISMEK